MSSVLITGANRGIGRAIATEFTRRGHRVIATARDPRSLADLDVSGRLALDVTDDASVTAAVAAAGEIDILISNAGAIFYAAVEAIPLPELGRVFDLNTVGAVRVAQAVLPQMRARGDGKLMSCPVCSAESCCRPPPRTPRRSGRWKGWSKPWPSKLRHSAFRRRSWNRPP